MLALPETIGLTTLPSLLAACLVLVAGSWLTRSVAPLARYNIPSPIVGGVLFAVLALLLAMTTGTRIALEASAKSTLLLVFFAAIGLTADLHLLMRGGARLLRFLAVLLPFLFAQNALGLLVAKLLGLHPVMGLLGGSITLIGGHGTGAAYAERFAEQHNIPGIMELTMTSATLGLVIGGLIGGPVAQLLIRRHRLGGAGPAVDGGVVGGPQVTPVNTNSIVAAMAMALVAVLGGKALGAAFEGGAITMPGFLWCLLLGLAIRNGGALVGLRPQEAAADLLGSVSLSLFLAWTMMALDLGTVLQQAGPLLVILACQTVLVIGWSALLAFRLLGRDYEGAVMSAAFCGFAMGATATAIANMQAVTKRYGPAPQAFIIVPIVGAFFVDLMNALVLTIFLALPFVAG